MTGPPPPRPGVAFEREDLLLFAPGGAPQIVAWHTSRASNGPTQAVNNLAQRIKAGRVRNPN